MIPYTFHYDYGYHVLLPLWSNRNYKNIHHYFRDAETFDLQWHPQSKRRTIETIKWLRNNAKEIDVLHIFYYNWLTCFYIYVYKHLNRNGLVYVHLDSNGESEINHLEQIKGLKKQFLKFLIPKQISYDILWGCQNEKNCQKLKEHWPFMNVLYIPDGFGWNNQTYYKPMQQRNNWILTVARNGTPQKRTDILMNGFAAVSSEFPEWKLVIAGSVEDNFKSFINDYFNSHPELKEKVIFTGQINDRDKLQKLYADSKIFALPSAWESFGIATIEALSMGCYVIASDIPATKNIIENNKYGSLFKCNDQKDFIAELRSILNSPNRVEETSKAGYDYANEHYNWKTILKPVDVWIKSKEAKMDR